MAGRPRKPTAVLELTGRLKHDRKRFANRANEPVNNDPLGDPPARLDATEREIWLELQAKLVTGVALVSDDEAFDHLVELVAKRRRRVITASERAVLLKLYTHFGMTPADRSRVSAPKKPHDANPFAKIG